MPRREYGVAPYAEYGAPGVVVVGSAGEANAAGLSGSVGAADDDGVVVDNDDGVVVVGSVELDAAIVGAPATGPPRSQGLGGDTIDDASCVCLCSFLSGGASSPSLADLRLPGAGVCVVA